MSAATTTAEPATPARATALPLGTPAAYAAEVLGTFVLVPAVSGTAPQPIGTGNVDMFLVGYVIGPVAGALIAAVAYTLIVLNPQQRIEKRPIDTLS